MANIDCYIICGSKQPEFNAPSGDQSYMYSSEASSHKAKTVDGAKGVVEDVFSNLNKLVSDLDSIKSDFDSLANSWNNCIRISGVDSTYVKNEEINSAVQSAQDDITSGESTCVGSLDGYNSTIQEINSFLDTLTQNYDTYQTLRTQLEGALANVAACIKAGDESEKLQYIADCNRISKEMEKYKEINDIESYGRWVE